MSYKFETRVALGKYGVKKFFKTLAGASHHVDSHVWLGDYEPSTNNDVDPKTIACGERLMNRMGITNPDSKELYKKVNAIQGNLANEVRYLETRLLPVSQETREQLEALKSYQEELESRDPQRIEAITDALLRR